MTLRSELPAVLARVVGDGASAFVLDDRGAFYARVSPGNVSDDGLLLVIVGAGGGPIWAMAVCQAHD
jgi:hypothetical protein